MFSDSGFKAAADSFERVLHHYDGLKGAVITWTLAHGNDNHDPSVLAWVLDPDGKVIEKCPSGTTYTASAMASWLKKMGQASFPLVDPADYPLVKSEAARIAKRSGLGSTAAKLQQILAEEGLADDKRQQASALLAKIEGYASFQADRAGQLESSDPAAALEAYKKLASALKGHEAGTRAKARHDAMRKDPKVKQEIAANKLLTQLQAVGESFKPHKYRAGLQYGHPDFVKKNKAKLNQARALVAAIQKRYPDTNAAREAAKLATAWKLTP